jgi:hypoxanthine phosphoribosyltransferase
LFSEEQLQERIRELARQISADYKGRTLTVVCVLDNGFLFMADLVRQLEIPVICQFLKPSKHEAGDTVEIVIAPGIDVRGQHVLLVEGLVQSGITSQFVMNYVISSGATSVKLATLLDKQSGRRIDLQPDYYGFLVDSAFLVGFGLGAPHLGRNLPYVASVKQVAG